MERAYRTIVYGGFAQDEGFVESNLGRSKTDRKKMAVYPASEPHTKYAYTGYQVLERLNNFTMLECRLKTGRTHQIRVHMAGTGHPLLGDTLYNESQTGKASVPGNPFTRAALHAWKLKFYHPFTGNKILLEAPFPLDFENFLEKK